MLQKPPRPLFEHPTSPQLFAFSPNREILGGTAYFVQTTEGNLLIDCPAWTEETIAWLTEKGGVRWLVLTHRGGMAKVREIQRLMNCEIVIQEQEAYLLPNLTVTTFHHSHLLTPEIEVLWTSGHSPGMSCIYIKKQGGILFTGRHLLPDRNGNPAPLRISKTFHWKRQLKNVQTLRDRFTAETLAWICPGASTGYLRGATAIGDAAVKLRAIDLDRLANAEPGL
jgi:glyoxylase-like metal-dependent hydrolase (beta-lactamase superfamily II)